MDLLGYLCFAGVLATSVIVVVHTNRRSAFSHNLLLSLLIGGYAAVYGIVPLVVGPGDADTYGIAGLATLLGLGGLLGGWHLFPRRARRGGDWFKKDIYRDRRPIRRMCVAATIVAVTGFVLHAYVLAGSLGGYLDAGRFEYRSSIGPLSLVTSVMTRAALVPPFLLCRSQYRSHKHVGYAYALVAATLLYLGFDGTRAAAIGVLGSAMVGRLLADPDERSASRRKHTARLARLATLAVVAVVLSTSLYTARSTLKTDGIAVVVDSLANPSSLGEIVQSESLGYSRFLFEAVEHFPEDRDFMWAYPLRRTIFFFMPSGSDFKPPDMNNEFAKTIGMRDDVTVPATLPGEGYIAAGGVVGAALWMTMYGWLGSALNRLQRTRRVWFIAVGAGTVELVLVVLRGQLYESTVRIVSLAAMVALLDIYARARFSKSPTAVSSNPLAPGERRGREYPRSPQVRAARSTGGVGSHP